MHFRHLICLELAVALLVPLPLLAQAPTPLGNSGQLGSASDLEIATYGEHVEAGRVPVKAPVGLDRLMLTTITAAYNIAGQYGQALRVCKYRESKAAEDADEVREARACRITMLVKLQRFTEAERLAYEHGTFTSVGDGRSLSEVNRWMLIASLALAQGSTEFASVSLNRAVAIAESLQTQPATSPQGISQELARSMSELQADILKDARRDSLVRLARIAYQKQDAEKYEVALKKIMPTAAVSFSNVLASIAMDNADSLVQLGRTEYARELARRSLQHVKADAGFRDSHEPLQSFEVSEYSAAALGDERFQPVHVTARIRLARAYILLGRVAEAVRLLESAKSLAEKYILEPPEGNTLVAAVEEAQGDQLLQAGDISGAINAFRAARSKLLVASNVERSSEYGRRHIGFDSVLLRVSAKLLGTVAHATNGVLLPPEQADEVLSIATDFSASRANGSAQQAARNTREIRPQLRSLLDREGQLVDELIDYRGALAAQATTPLSAITRDIPGLQQKLSTLYAELSAIKLQLTAEDSAGPAQNSESLLRRLAARIGDRDAIWQWVLSPGNNVIICITAQGIRLSRLDTPSPVLGKLASDLHQAATLRGVNTASNIQPFPRQKSAVLYRLLFGSLAELSGQKNHWILVPPPLLDRVPWAALVVPPEVQQRQHGIWLVERVALTSTPSITAWVQLGERGKSTASMDMLGVGDPQNRHSINTAQLKTRGSVVSSITPAVDVKPSSSSIFSAELQGISRLFRPGKTTLLSGSSASKAQFLRLPLDRYRVILFSTHGYLSGEMLQAIGPSLEMTGTTEDPMSRFLTASEIARLRLDSDLVFLSACDTSASDGQIDSEGFSGLTSAFLLAGSRTVVASLWPVETSATESLVRRTFESHQADMSRPIAFAMQSAMRSSIASPRLLWRHPAFWSAFVVVGR